MGGNNFYDIAKDFVSPAGIAVSTLIISYFIALYQSRKKQSEDLNARRLAIIDTILIEINRLNTIFDDLQKDPDEQQFFKFKNINSAKPSIEKLQKIFDELIIFPDDSLRKRLLTDIDLVGSLTEDLSNLESFASAEANKFSYAESEILKELRKLKIDLLKMDIRLDTDSNPQSVNPKIKLNNDKKKATRELYDNLNAAYVDAKNKNQNAITFCKEKRVYYTSQIIGAQGRLSELELLLNAGRDQLINKKSLLHSKISIKLD